MNVVCWYVDANTFLELEAIDLAVLTAVPHKAADIVGCCRHTCIHCHADVHSHSSWGVQPQALLKHHIQVLQAVNSVIH